MEGSFFVAVGIGVAFDVVKILKALCIGGSRGGQYRRCTVVVGILPQKLKRNGIGHEHISGIADLQIFAYCGIKDVGDYAQRVADGTFRVEHHQILHTDAPFFQPVVQKRGLR